eukprot:m.714633 g.714633  ORF g.714633 m.714633 type:complete len:95 (+) comp58783_c0_seq71:1586-1870(+)
MMDCQVGLMLEEDSHQLDMPPVDSVKEWAHLILVEHIHSRALLEEFLRNFHTIREARNQQRCEFVVVSHFHRCLSAIGEEETDHANIPDLRGPE